MIVNALMITTNIPDRFHLLEDTIQSVENANNGLLRQKVLSIDIMEQHPFDLNYFQKYKELGWTIVSGECSGYRGMCNNIMRGLGALNESDYIYYVEDDVIINSLPDPKSFEDFGKENIGFACFNTHISDKPDPQKISFINNDDNYKKIGDEMFLIKKECIKDQYYLNFPSAFIKDSVFRDLINYAANNSKGLGMEPGLTKAWFDLGFNKQYDVCVYVKQNVLHNKPFNLQTFHNQSNMQFWNNDENLRHPSINERKNTLF